MTTAAIELGCKSHGQHAKRVNVVRLQTHEPL